MRKHNQVQMLAVDHLQNSQQDYTPRPFNSLLSIRCEIILLLLSVTIDASVTATERLAIKLSGTVIFNSFFARLFSPHRCTSISG